MSVAPEQSASPKGNGPRLAAVVLMVRDVHASSTFYAQLLRMTETVQDEGSALLVSRDSSEIYMRRVGPRVPRSAGSVGPQCVIWTAADSDDLDRCEAVLEREGALVGRDTTEDGFSVVEGRDPDGSPILISFPGPDTSARQHIMSRIYQYW